MGSFTVDVADDIATVTFHRDMMVASDNATFGTAEINAGLLGASAHLSMLVGRHKAREMFFTGELVPAEQSYTGRLVRLDDATEARTAFLENREPEWKWR